MKLLLVLALAGVALSEVYFEETFQDGDAWESRWVQSTSKGADGGKFVLTAGKFYGDAEKEMQEAKDKAVENGATGLEEVLQAALAAKAKAATKMLFFYIPPASGDRWYRGCFWSISNVVSTFFLF